MTERLARLMTLEADLLDVPPAPTSVVRQRGRGMRRRRHAGQAVAGLAALVLVGSGLALLQHRADDNASVVDPAGPSPTTGAGVADVGVAFTIGTTVYLDGGAVTATIDDKAVKSLYYTSAGLLVRHGNNPNSDGGGPQRFSLVTPDGTVKPVGVETEGTVHATDPTQPYLVYVQEIGGVATVLVHDVETDEQVAQVPLPGANDSYSSPAIDGDTVYVRNGRKIFVVDWRSGDVSTSDTLVTESVAGGHVAVSGDDQARVIDVATGATLVESALAAGSYGYLTLSPDGSGAVLSSEDMPARGEQQQTTVYDVASGDSFTAPGSSYDVGWSATGDLFRVSDDGTLTTCTLSTGECSDTRLDLAVLPNSAPDAGIDCNLAERSCGFPSEDSDDDLVLGGTTRES